MVLVVPEPERTEIDGLRRACGDSTLDLVPPHVTLVPPINVRSEEVDQAVGVLRAAAAASRPVELAIGPVSSFLPVTPVLFLVVGGGGVQTLVDLRRGAMRPPLERPSEWTFVPHVTLATDLAPARIDAAVSALAGFSVRCVIDRVNLMQEGDDRVWRPLADARLGPPMVVGRGGLPVELAVSERLDPEAERFLEAAWRRHLIESYGAQAGEREAFAITARREGTVVGVAQGMVVGGTQVEAVLDRLVVAPEVRGQGIGSHLLAALEAWGAERGCTRLSLVAQADGPVEAFCRSRGWRVEQRLPAWRPGRDFVRMVRGCQRTPVQAFGTPSTS